MRQRFIQSFSTSGDVQTAIDGGQLGKPYVALVSESGLDFNTMSPAAPESKPLTFDILTDGYINWEASISPSDAKAIRYSLNGGEWTEIISVDGGDCRIPVVAGDTLRFLGDNERYGTADGWPANRFANSTAEFNARGNIMSLVDSENFDTLTTVSPNAFNGLFRNARTLKDASGLVLPATTLAQFCYQQMFNNCTSLTSAPALPATTLADRCYNIMFYNCTNLNYIKCLATDITASSCTDGWVSGVSSAGTFIKAASMSDWTTGVNGIPANWTVEDADI